ncbi:RidA family protein [Asticcacaulis sp. SL142]|uniref:RidA family protein n=1 Tax=Asticcacaulis sp. SL142 TaxID=2995155 RepID=UPI00226CC97C|nr:RidA family protein [Asticcacaulis sp. SL142]WAC47287.1 RidA family protein [Asticcacaulis sp. SL142]
MLKPGAHQPGTRLTPSDEVQFFLHPHPRSPFSEAVQVGNVLYISAMIGLDSEGTLVEGFEPQTRQTLSNLAEILGKYGLGLEHVFKVTVMMTDMTKWGEFNKIYRTYFHPSRLPVRTAFGVAGLAFDAMVELEVQAYIPTSAEE